MVHNHTYLELLDDGQVFSVVEWITFFVALGLHLSIVPVATHLYKSGHTDEFPYWVYIVNFINSYGLAMYSALSDCYIMILLNVIGMAVYGTCITIYVLVTNSWTWPLLKLAAMLASTWWIRHYTSHVAPPDEHEDFLGTLTMTTTAISLLPPLLHVNHFRRQQSCAGMPVAMSVFGFLACICWTVYGKLLDDPYTYLPNITGFIGCAVYLSMALYYGFPDPHAHKHKKTD